MRDGSPVWGKKKCEQNLTQLFCFDNPAGLFTAINNQAIIRWGSGLGERCWPGDRTPQSASAGPRGLCPFLGTPTPSGPLTVAQGRWFCWCPGL